MDFGNMANLPESSDYIPEITQVDAPDSETQSKSGGNMDSEKTDKLPENPEIQIDSHSIHESTREEARRIIENVKSIYTGQTGKKPFIACPKILPNESSLHQPRTVSIGPHFRGLTNTLYPMEYIKVIGVDKLFNGNSKVTSVNELFGVHSETLVECIKCIQILEKEARGYYERIVSFSREDFIQILLLDSIFLIALIMVEDYRNSIFQNIPHVFLDLILMENQVPFFIIREVWGVLVSTGVIKSEYSLETGLKLLPFWKEGLSVDISRWNEIETLTQLYYLWNVPIPKRASKRRNPPLLKKLIAKLKTINPWKKHIFSSIPERASNRCIDLLQLDEEFRRVGNINPFQEESQKIGSLTQTRDKRITSAMPSATELYEAGIEFKAKTTFKNMLEISFENGRIEIPTMLIDSTFMSFIVNLLSFEKFFSDDSKNVASYVCFVDSLINTKNDVALLQNFGVVNNKLVSDDAAAAFINSIGESCGISTFNSNNFYAPVIEDIMEYVASRWRRDWTSLKHTYFSNPWTGISVFAGSFLLILSCVQTYYTIFPRGH